MRRLLFAGVLVGLAVVASTVGVQQSVAQAARDPKEIQAVVEQLRKIPIGSDIRVQLVDGQKLEAVLLDVTSSSIQSWSETTASTSRPSPLTRLGVCRN